MQKSKVVLKAHEMLVKKEVACGSNIHMCTYRETLFHLNLLLIEDL